MQQNAASLDMAQKPIAEASTLMRPFNDPGDIRHDKFLAINANYPKIGVQGREGIICDLWPGGGYSAQKGRFASIWQTEQTGIGNELQP